MRPSLRACTHLLFAACCLLTSSAWAQDDQPQPPDDRPTPSHHPHRRDNPNLREVPTTERQGAWVTLGVGVGSESSAVPSTGFGYTPSLEKPSFDLQAGGTLGSHFRLGGELFAWLNQQGNVLESVSDLLVVGKWYPSATSGFFLKAGAGLGRYGFDYIDGPNSGDLGFAGVIGGGYEFRIARKIFLAPIVDLHESTFSSRAFRTYHERVANFGLSILFQQH